MNHAPTDTELKAHAAARASPAAPEAAAKSAAHAALATSDATSAFRRPYASTIHMLTTLPGSVAADTASWSRNGAESRVGKRVEFEENCSAAGGEEAALCAANSSGSQATTPYHP